MRQGLQGLQGALRLLRLRACAVRATQKEKTVIGISQNFLVWVAFWGRILYHISSIPAIFRGPQIWGPLSVK